MIDYKKDARNLVPMKRQFHSFLHSDQYVRAINNWIVAANNAFPTPTLKKVAVNVALSTAKGILQAMNYLIP